MLLLVEDDTELRSVIVKILESSNLKITKADSGNMAIQYLKDGLEVDIIISDYAMPDGDGALLLNYLLINNYSIPFVLFTNTINPVIPHYRMLLGILDKFDFQKLQKLIQGEL